MNREAWLTALAEKLRPLFEELKSPLPAKLHISVGWPSRGALSTRKQRIGEHWMATDAEGGRHIFISPVLPSAAQAAETLVHELVHAALPDETKHKRPFVDLMKKVGLEGKPTATHAGSVLRARLETLSAELGPYPHPGLAATGREKKQSTRMKKVKCATCGYTVRVTEKWLAVGTPICPTDKIPMEEV